MNYSISLRKIALLVLLVLVQTGCTAASNQNDMEIAFTETGSYIKEIHSDDTSVPEITTDFVGSKAQQKPNPRYLQSDPCSKYSDCYDCSSNPKCYWSITGCSTSLTQVSKNWWDKMMTCVRYKPTPPACPSPRVYLMGLGGSIEFSLPDVSKQSTPLPANSFCYWKILNPKGYPLRIRIKRFSTADKLAMVTDVGTADDADLRDPSKGLKSIRKVPTSITFYYTNTAPMSFVSLQVHLATPIHEASSAATVVLLIVLGLVSAILLYGFIAILYFCIKRNSVFYSTRAREQAWINGAQKRLDKIMKSTIELKYNSGDAQFLQTSCAICLVEFENGCNLRKLPCPHIYHKDCIDAWIKARIREVPRCPMCNLELTDERPPEGIGMSINTRPRRGSRRQRQRNERVINMSHAESPNIQPVHESREQIVNHV